MWNEPTKARLQKIPKLYETEDTPLEEKWIHLHFFLAGCDWYVAEFDGEDLFWGFAILNNDYEMAEWGYISFRELKELETCHGFEVDCELPEYWEVKEARFEDGLLIVSLEQNVPEEELPRKIEIKRS